ncbi:glycosyltransferase [Sphingobium sp. AP49]|uniref:glycosyltransferase n=1 Tax=Sphingobium sp. AP49 TaxID=1144307 RepID=UPI00026EE172|nr:glycosyltransferase [Sphingobium sp. AP49]WHO38482.1 glycosyltransferase [Sphingobium sp. AP49]
MSVNGDGLKGASSSKPNPDDDGTASGTAKTTAATGSAKTVKASSSAASATKSTKAKASGAKSADASPSKTTAAPAAPAEDLGAFWDADLGRYTLQPVMIRSVAETFAPHIFYRTLEGATKRSDNGIKMSAGAKVGFNNYVNSFYAAYWLKHTTVSAISLSGVLTGNALLHLFKSTPSGQTIHIGSYPVGVADEREVFHIHFDLYGFLPTDGGPGRYFFDLEAVNDLEVEKISFTTFVPPAREASFSLGICTYQKEDYVTNIGMMLEKYMATQPTVVRDVYIVNNDKTFDKLPALSDLGKRDPRFHMIAQGNVGGAGGFSRTLQESLSGSGSTHHIFMDDDAFIDPNVLDRLHAFVSYAREEIIVGGHMMDMKRPHMVYEGGAKLDYWGFLQKVGDNLDASSHLDATFYDKLREVDYNAWWFACVPKSVAMEIGLPLNIFIRGDDFEYGLRMRAKKGIKTVSLPGLFVWHEPFEGKTASWLEYYNWRNRFMICSLYADPKSLTIQPVEMLRDIIVDHLEGQRDEIAFVMCLAIVDFLSGPEAILQSDAEAFHTNLRAILATLKVRPSAFAELLSARLEVHGPIEQGSQVVDLRRSPRLGGKKRAVDEIRWIESDLVPVIDAVLGRYEANVEALCAEWKEKAHKLSSREAWTALYWSDTKKADATDATSTSSINEAADSTTVTTA